MDTKKIKDIKEEVAEAKEKEQKNELTDDALEAVTGGYVAPVILHVGKSFNGI